MTQQRKSTLPFGERRRIGRYELIAQLKCDFGQRWVGTASEGESRGEPVYLRQFPTERLSLPELQLLNRAAVTAMVIRHTNIAAVLDVLDDGGRLTVVSEYREAESLSALLGLSAESTSPMPPSVGLSVLADVVAAQLAADKQWGQMVPAGDKGLQGATHGGLIPDGVMLTSAGEVLVTEVGIVGIVMRHCLRDPAVIPYRAPEQLTRGHGATGRCDVFSAAVLAWEMMAARALFGAPTRLHEDLPQHPDQLVQALLHGPITPLDRLSGPGAAVPYLVVEILRNMLLRDPLKRYGSLESASAELGGLGRGLFATPDDVAMSVARLAGPALRIRRELIDFNRTGSMPDTDAPPAQVAKPAVPVTVPGPSAPPPELLEPGVPSKRATLRFPALQQEPPGRERPSQRAALRPESERVARRSKPPPAPAIVAPRPAAATQRLGTAVTETPHAPALPRPTPPTRPEPEALAPIERLDDELVFDSAPPAAAAPRSALLETPLVPGPDDDVHDRMTLAMPEQTAELAAGSAMDSDAPPGGTEQSGHAAAPEAPTHVGADVGKLADANAVSKPLLPELRAAPLDAASRGRRSIGVWLAIGFGLVLGVVLLALPRRSDDTAKVALPSATAPAETDAPRAASSTKPPAAPDPPSSGSSPVPDSAAGSSEVTPKGPAPIGPPKVPEPPVVEDEPPAAPEPAPSGPYRPEGI
jgi:serine/threonine protein kinase